MKQLLFLITGFTFFLSSTFAFASTHQGWSVALGADQPAHTHKNCPWTCKQIGDECVVDTPAPDTSLKADQGTYMKAGYGQGNVYTITTAGNAYNGCCQLIQPDSCPSLPPSKGKWD